MVVFFGALGCMLCTMCDGRLFAACFGVGCRICLSAWGLIRGISLLLSSLVLALRFVCMYICSFLSTFAPDSQPDCSRRLAVTVFRVPVAVSVSRLRGKNSAGSNEMLILSWLFLLCPVPYVAFGTTITGACFAHFHPFTCCLFLSFFSQKCQEALIGIGSRNIVLPIAPCRFAVDGLLALNLHGCSYLYMRVVPPR